jgi:DNA transformation protein
MGIMGERHSDDVGASAEEVVESLRSLGNVSWKRMFGGAGVFIDGSMFALIDSDAQLHLKVDDSNRARFEAAGSQKHARMPYYTAPADLLEDETQLLEWAEESARIARR